ncbi:hypothetical protein [Rhodopirellula bahusiensis]|uniref:hypothetical protein n=1 Tax=Rhodopirellula bahusiensis TaxID=2014065 RepID=UPI003263705B
MNDPFIQSEWQALCEHVHLCASGIANDASEQTEFQSQADEFSAHTPPTRYTELLAETAAAARLAVQWQDQTIHDADDHRIDEASEESFPASDPPEFNRTHA